MKMLRFGNVHSMTVKILVSEFKQTVRWNGQQSVKGHCVDSETDEVSNKLHRVTMIKGGGLGPEMMDHVENVLCALKAYIVFEKYETSGLNLAEKNKAVVDAVMSIRRNKVGIAGNMESIRTSVKHLSPNILLRNTLDLFVNVVHIRSYPAVPCKYKNIDIIVCRQNTEGEYSMIEHETLPGVVESLKIITREKSEQIARFAFEYAKIHRRKNITTVHKANIMKMSDGLFLECARKVAEEYSGSINHQDMIVDNTCMQIISNPAQFDMILLPNLYGTILTNILCGLTGGAGLPAGANIGRNYAVFETASRSLGLGLVGKNQANPVTWLNATANMIEYLGQAGKAKILRNAIMKTLCIDQIRTKDIGGKNTSTEVIDSILNNLNSQVHLVT